MMATIPKASFVKLCMAAGASKEACESEDTKASLYGAQKASIDHTTNLATGEHLEAMTAMVEAEEDPNMKKYFAERLKRVKAAAECKEDAGCWSGKLTHKDPLIRERAAWTLLRLNDKSAAGALAKALGDKDDKVRSAAIQAYWALGDKSAVSSIEKILETEKSQLDYVKVNEDLKRLLISLKRA